MPSKSTGNGICFIKRCLSYTHRLMTSVGLRLFPEGAGVSSCGERIILPEAGFRLAPGLPRPGIPDLHGRPGQA